MNSASLTFPLLRPAGLPPAVRTGAGLLILLAAVSCRPAGSTPAPRRTEFIPPPPEPARAATSTSAATWLSAWESVREELSRLSAELETEQAPYTGWSPAEYLEADPASLSDDELGCLVEYLRRGYFRVEREALVAWLERRKQHLGQSAAEPAVTGRGAIAHRLQSAMRNDEQMLVDLEAVISIYQRIDRSAFTVSESLTEPERARMLAEAVRLREAEQKTIAELDRRISDLQAELASR